MVSGAMLRIALVVAVLSSVAAYPRWRSKDVSPSKEECETSMKGRKLASLSVDEVSNLLSNLDMGKYEAGFRALPVNGAMLATADDADLREAGVEFGMHRKALLHRVKEFGECGVCQDLIVSSPQSMNLSAVLALP